MKLITTTYPHTARITYSEKALKHAKVHLRGFAQREGFNGIRAVVTRYEDGIGVEMSLHTNSGGYHTRSNRRTMRILNGMLKDMLTIYGGKIDKELVYKNMPETRRTETIVYAIPEEKECNHKPILNTKTMTRRCLICKKQLD